MFANNTLLRAGLGLGFGLENKEKSKEDQRHALLSLWWQTWTSLLVTCLWYNLDPELESELQTGVCKTQILMQSINNCMNGSRFSSQVCCVTAVWKRCRDGALCRSLLSCIIPTLFAYFLVCHPYIFLFSCFYTFSLVLISVTARLKSWQECQWQYRLMIVSLTSFLGHVGRGKWPGGEAKIMPCTWSSSICTASVI